MKAGKIRKHAIVAALVFAASGAAAAELDGTLKKIRETGEISLGVRETSVPFNYQDDKQQYMGYSLDLCMLVADAVRAQLKMPDLKVKFTPTTAATRIPLLANGTTDMQCDGASNTVDRQKQVAFSPTVFITGNRFMSKKSDNIQKLEDLRGKTVVAMTGTTNIRQINELNKQHNLGMRIQGVTEHSEAFLMVDTGRAVAYAQDDIFLAGLIAAAKQPDQYVISETALSVDPYGLMLRRDDPAFKKIVDETLTAGFASGKVREIYKRWFESPIPPRGIDLNWPVSKYLDAAFKSPTDSPDPGHYAALVK